MDRLDVFGATLQRAAGETFDEFLDRATIEVADLKLSDEWEHNYSFGQWQGRPVTNIEMHIASRAAEHDPLVIAKRFCRMWDQFLEELEADNEQ